MKKFKTTSSLIFILATSLLLPTILSIQEVSAAGAGAPSVDALNAAREKMRLKREAAAAAAARGGAGGAGGGVGGPRLGVPHPPVAFLGAIRARGLAPVAALGGGVRAPRVAVDMSLGARYPDEFRMIEKVKVLASKMDFEEVVVDPAARLQLSEEKKKLELKIRGIEAESVAQRNIAERLVNEMSDAALINGVTPSKVNAYKTLMLRGKDLNAFERAAIVDITGIRGTSLKQKGISEALSAVALNAGTKEYLGQKIGIINGKLNIMGRDAAPPDVTEQQIKKIQTLVETIMGVGAKQDDLSAIVRGFAQYLRKGEVTEDLCLNLKSYNEKMNTYVEKVEKQLKGVTFSSDGSSDGSAAAADRDRLLNEINELKKKINSVGTVSESGASSKSTEYSVSVSRIGDENNSAIIITDDKTGKRILADAESISHFLTESGEWDKASIKDKFDKEYIQEAQSEVTSNPKQYLEILEKLQSQGVELDNIDLDNSDSRVAALKDKDKALMFLVLNANSNDTVEKQRVKDLLVSASQLSSDITMSNMNVLTARLDDLTSFNSSATGVSGISSGGGASGVSSGDEEVAKKSFVPHGVWISGVYANARQKEHGEVSAYKSKSGGGTIGVDFSVNDEGTIVGASYSRIVSNITTNNPTNSKFKAQANVFSVYGKVPLNDKFDLSTIVAANHNIFTHKYKKMVGDNNYQMAKGKFTDNGFNAKVLLDYKVTLGDNFMIIPMVSIDYSNQTNSAYTESGAGVYNLAIDSRNTKGFNGSAGIKLSKGFLVANTQIAPMLQVSMDKDFGGKKERIKANYLWASASSKETHVINKTSLLGYNLGGGVAINHNNIEVSTIYNCHLKKKYIGHQGALKLKVFF